MRAVLLIFVLCMSTSVRGQSITEPHFSNLSINSMGDLQWTVTYHQDLSFSVHIEKLVNDKWVDLGLGLGGFSLAEKDPSLMQTTTSSTRVKFHKGLNVYRLVMTFPDKIVSPEIKLESETSNDDGSLWIINNSILLDEAVDYEILNSVGTVIAKGEGKTINISNLKEGSYFLYTKNWTKSFSK